MNAMGRTDAFSAAQNQETSGSSRVTINLLGREYSIVCGDGEEERLEEIIGMVEDVLKEIADKNVGASETRMFMLACLMLADNIIDARQEAREDRIYTEDLMVAAVEHLQQRIKSISSCVGEQQQD